MISRNYLIRSAAIGALALATMTSAAAQTGAAVEGEDIVVTGSRIRGVGPVGSALIAVDQARIEQTPVISTNDLLRRVPQVVSLGANRQGGSAQNGDANVTRGAGINLRGIGTSSTLLLVDGMRFPPQGPQGQFVDPSVIPAIALERVDVVADGASAIYGSDAVAGVVNFIRRKNFDGAEFRLRSGFTKEGYNEQQVAGLLGRKWDGGWLTVAGEYSRNSALIGSALDFYQNDNRARGGTDYRSDFCNPGTITAGGNSYAIPAGGVTAANAGALVPGTGNLCFYDAYGSVIPDQQRVSFTASASQEIADGIRLFADGFYSDRRGTLLSVSSVAATVPSTNPFFASPVPGADSASVNWSMFPERGVERNRYKGESWSASGGIQARLFGDWSATAYYSHGESSEVAGYREGVDGEALDAALADTDPATALNVFGGPNNPETLARIADSMFLITGKTRLDVANVQFDGSLAQLPGGALRLAVGGEYRKEYTFTDLEIGTSVSSFNIPDGGARNVKAAFAELFVPIFGADNARPGLEQLSLSLAGRYEKYSDFGSTSNPKIGLTYKPIRDVTLRGSFGTSFRAPVFAEVTELGAGSGLYFDQNLPGPTGPMTGIGIAGGNPDLKPETATTWSIGAEITPIALPGLRASINYFDINYKNQIQGLRGTPGILTNPLYASFVTLNPSADEVAALLASGLPLNTPIDPAQVEFIVDGRRQNIGNSRVGGIDFGVTYQWTMGSIDFDAGIQGTRFTKYKVRSVAGSPFTDVVGIINFPQKFRSQADVGMKWDVFQARLTWNHLSSYDNISVIPTQRISNYDTFDLYLGWDVTERFRFSIDVRNLFNEDPPFVDIPGGYDPQSANPVPRLISVTAGLKF